MTRLRKVAASPWLYAGWFLLSTAGLVVADHVHPYVLVAAVYVAVAASCAVGAIALFGGWRAFVLAVLAAAPTALACQRLSTIHWA